MFITLDFTQMVWPETYFFVAIIVALIGAIWAGAANVDAPGAAGVLGGLTWPLSVPITLLIPHGLRRQHHL